MDNKFSSKEFWKDKFGEYPQTDCEKLAVSMMKEYLDYWLLPNISKSTENLSKIKDKDEWLNKIRGNETNLTQVKTKVVCFCGSTRFAEWFMIKRWELEKQGIITFGINILPNNYFADGNAHGAEQEGVKEILDELHKRKIDLSDEVHVLNVNGYIGESTRSEIEYAKSVGKKVEYLEAL